MSALINTDKEYLEWVKDVVARYRQSQIKAAVKVNRELLAFYWSLGKDIVELKAESKWGERFYKSLSADLCAKLPDVHSFSETSLKYIKYFYSTYSQLITIRPQLEDELKTTLFSIPWGHQRVLLDKFKGNPEKAFFFVHKAQEQNWSRAVLLNFVDTDLYERQGKAISNFSSVLPAPQSDLAQEITKDPYNFNFLTLDKKYDEKDQKVPHYFNYELMKSINGGTQMRDVWRLPAIAPWEKSCGKHPTQKPLCVLSRIIQASTKPGAWILDPFTGGSTTGVAASLLDRRFLGIDSCEKFLELSKARREELNSMSVQIDYLDRLQKQAKLFEDSEVRVLNEKPSYYGPELPF